MEASWLLILVAVTLVAALRGVPQTGRHIILLTFGLLVGQLISTLRWQSGIGAKGMADAIYYLILPWLLVQAASSISRRRLRLLWPWVVGPASLIFLLTLSLVGVGLFMLVDHPGFPLLSGVVAGTLLAAADPSWSSQLAHRQRSLLVMLEGEGVWVELFAFAGLMVLNQAGSLSSLSGAEVGATWVRLLTLSLLLSWLLSWLLKPLLRRNGALTLPLAYLVFWGTERGLGLPGAAVCLLTLLLSLPQLRRIPTAPVEEGASLGADLLVVALGFSLTLSMFTERYWVMLAAIGLCLLARGPVLWGIVHWLKPPLPAGAGALWWRLPVHGPVTLALVLSLPVSVTAWWTIQSACYGVILFELLIQRPLASASVSDR
ncbi:hypothetical protein FCL40_10020 [Ferrimonas sediminicola]|uniref:Sodium:proton antiporter n=1 Tax=Ferrimonas sediminicola TaxID=2569538 RepID=A0A4U1BDC4_9GAMM|nr:hypothetical protein [Ferrimonas sediminicola]TKB48966.1 hypothetical protein FCL40_10020 [Ferrimonas sediminicola]